MENEYKQLERHLDMVYDYMHTKVDRRKIRLDNAEELVNWWALAAFEDEELTFDEAMDMINEGWSELKQLEYKGD